MPPARPSCGVTTERGVCRMWEDPPTSADIYTMTSVGVSFTTPALQDAWWAGCLRPQVVAERLKIVRQLDILSP